MPALRRAPLTIAMVVTALLALVAAFAPTAANATPTLLGGTLLITSGDDSSGLTGSYFEMREPGGNLITNPSTGQTYTLLRQGTRGLTLLTFDDGPTPAFDPRTGDALNNSIIQPTAFAGVDFSVATPRVDPGTSDPNRVPKIIVNLLCDPPKIIVDLRAWTAYWNDQTFNQGAKFLATSYDLRTRRIVLDWSARINSGPFRSFIGNWHIEGTVL